MRIYQRVPFESIYKKLWTEQMTRSKRRNIWNLKMILFYRRFFVMFQLAWALSIDLSVHLKLTDRPLTASSNTDQWLPVVIYYATFDELFFRTFKCYACRRKPTKMAENFFEFSNSDDFLNSTEELNQCAEKITDCRLGCFQTKDICKWNFLSSLFQF